MPDDDAMLARAKAEAEAVLTYFHNIEALGKFVGESVHDQKLIFLAMALTNFARREHWGHPSAFMNPGEVTK